jgi:hypothetical protein
MGLRPTQRDEKHLRFRNHFPLKGRPFLCHPERSRGICSPADPSWKCSSTERRDLRFSLTCEEIFHFPDIPR